MRETERERQRYRQREKQAPCREPDAGLDPGTLGSCPGPKAGAKLLSHPGISLIVVLICISLMLNYIEHFFHVSVGHLCVIYPFLDWIICLDVEFDKFLFLFFVFLVLVFFKRWFRLLFKEWILPAGMYLAAPFLPFKLYASFLFQLLAGAQIKI